MYYCHTRDIAIKINHQILEGTHKLGVQTPGIQGVGDHSGDTNALKNFTPKIGNSNNLLIK
jgi:hypothetical protein